MCDVRRGARFSNVRGSARLGNVRGGARFGDVRGDDLALANERICLKIAM
jgi:hypothetical protein